MILRILILLITTLSFSTLSYSQKESRRERKFRKKFEQAHKMMEKEDYVDALSLWLELNKSSPGNANINFLIGFCYQKVPRNNKEAVGYLEKASGTTSDTYKQGDTRETYAPIESIRYLGDAHHLNLEFTSAISAYKRYLSELDESQEKLIADIVRQIEVCENALKLVADPVNLTIVNLGEGFNSPEPDYSALITADESMLFFTSRRQGGMGGKTAEDGKPFEDIYYSEKIDGKWSEIKNIGAPINSANHEAAIGISADGQQLYIYKFDKESGGDIFHSTLSGTKWSEPVKLGSDINTPYWESHFSISADGQTLFFASNRPGGYGERDIYMAKKLPTGEWALALNLGNTINTVHDEAAPYIHPDGKSLYFSSRGHNSMGGLDIFVSKVNDYGFWSKPRNIGYPVNSSADDIFFTPSSDGKRAYYSSYRNDGIGDYDIYLMLLPEEEEKHLTILKGTLSNTFGQVPEDVFIYVYDNNSGDLIGKYKPNTSSGKYLLTLPEGGNYNISYKSADYLLHSENILVPENSSYSQVENNLELQPVKVGARSVLRNIFFDENKSELQKESMVELTSLFELLSGKADVKVEISGHTDSKGSDDYNLSLSQRRCQSVVDYLVQKGIAKERLVAKGYGETMPMAPNVNPDGSDNTAGRAKNRRIEMKVIN